MGSSVHAHGFQQARAWLGARDNLVFAVLLVLQLVPIWAFEHLVTQDGPAHIENADIIRRYYEPAAGILRQYYELNYQLTPNWFGHLALAALLSITPESVAEKVFQSGYVILLPISIRYAVSAGRPDSAFLALLAFPFVYSFPFHMGFYAFSYSLPMFFFVSGYWLRHREWFSVRQTGTLAILFLVLYLCHSVSLGAACLEIALLAAVMTAPELFNHARTNQFDSPIVIDIVQHRLIGPACACVPAIAMLAVFAIQRSAPDLAFAVSWTDKSPPKSASVPTDHSLFSRFL